MLFYLQILCFYLVWHPSNSKNTYDITRSAALLTPGTEVNVTTGRTTFWVVCLCSFWVQRRTCRKMHERQKYTCQECPLCKMLRLQTGCRQDFGVFSTCLKEFHPVYDHVHGMCLSGFRTSFCTASTTPKNKRTHNNPTSLVVTNAPL